MSDFFTTRKANSKEIEGIARDITQLQKSHLELMKSKEIAEKSLKVKEQFLANMSHEIRTPMNGNYRNDRSAQKLRIERGPK